MVVSIALAGLLPALVPQQPAAGAPTAAPTPALVPMRTLPLKDVHLDGWLADRIDANRKNWLAKVDLDERLEPFVHRPAKQAWAGEHLGKWLSAAALCWQNTPDLLVRSRLDAATKALLKVQEEDGYLGTYMKAERFQLLPGADWDVWTIKYAMLGLLDVHAATGDERALAACRRAANLLIATFGPGQRSILMAGQHVGMAATSVLEPIARLYALTTDKRYLDFANYLVDSWDDAGGPRIASALRAHTHVAQVANGKAYEMLSNLVGLCELARAADDRSLLAPAIAAFDDIVADELLPTGSMSSHECFIGGGRRPAAMSANLAETCVTVTWLQLCRLLFEQTGDAKYGRELERTICNHLLAAQKPDGAEWCYYTPLLGTKPYDTAITCCSSSGPRGIANIARCAAFVDDAGRFVLDLPFSMHGEVLLGSERVKFEVQSGLPRTGNVRIKFETKKPASFAVRLRLSEWAVPATLRVGTDVRKVDAAGFCDVNTRKWEAGDAIELTLRCDGTKVVDPADDQRQAVQWGPCVLALPLDAGAPAVVGGVLDGPAKLVESPILQVQQRFVVDGKGIDAVLVPFADAGARGGPFRVWIPQRRGAAVASETRSRPGNRDGSIADGDRDSYAVTFDGKGVVQDWFAIALTAPQAVRSVTFAHGQSFHDGGWFDCTRGKPIVQARAGAGDEWRTIGQLDDYPATTATDSKGLRPGQQFTLQLAAPLTVGELRVAGAPACGDNARQAFASCAELWAQ